MENNMNGKKLAFAIAGTILGLALLTCVFVSFILWVTGNFDKQEGELGIYEVTYQIGKEIKVDMIRARRFTYYKDSGVALFGEAGFYEGTKKVKRLEEDL